MHFQYFVTMERASSDCQFCSSAACSKKKAKQCTKFSLKVPKHIVFISAQSYSVPVMFIGMFLTAGQVLADCQHPGAFVIVIAWNGCLNVMI